MRLTKTGWVVVPAMLVLGSLGVAAAQTQATPSDQPAAEVGTSRDVQLPPEQMLSEANKAMPSMEQGASTVRKQLEEARRARDVVKVLCLNDKLNQIDVAIRSARDRVTSLRGAVDQKDQDRARHEFTIIEVLRDRVRALVAEANQCIGEETGFLGESRVTVEISPEIPDIDPSQFPEDPVISQPPVLSSPTQ